MLRDPLVTCLLCHACSGCGCTAAWHRCLLLPTPDCRVRKRVTCMRRRRFFWGRTDRHSLLSVVAGVKSQSAAIRCRMCRPANLKGPTGRQPGCTDGLSLAVRVLVNPSGERRSVDLGGIYKKLMGAGLVGRFEPAHGDDLVEPVAGNATQASGSRDLRRLVLWIGLPAGCFRMSHR